MAECFDNIQMAILAGGLATRLKDLTEHQPKSMVEVCRKPFLEYQLELLHRGGIKNVVLCLGHLGRQIERHFGDGSDYGMNIKYSFEEIPLGTAGALRKAEALLNDTFFTMYGDSYLFLDFSLTMSHFKSQNKLALMTVYKNCNHYYTNNAVVEGNQVKHFSNDEKTADMAYIEYGANIFRKKALELIPHDKFYSLNNFFSHLVERNELLACEAKERFYEIGSPRGLKEFEEYIESAE